MNRLSAIAAALTFAVGAAAPVVPAQAGPAASDRCPEVVVVAARGSEQNDGPEPARYSEQAPWTSNGYEATHLSAFLHYAEARHLERAGTSLMADVHVLGLDDSVYPASLPLPALAEEDEELTPVQTAQRLGEVLAESPAHVIADNAARGFVEGVRSGIDGTPDYLAAWEGVTGCTPGYLLLGYSQGAIVLTAQEQALAEQGRLVGSLYFGNPLLRPGASPVVGSPERGAGLLAPVPQGMLPAASTSTPRLDYCLRGDFACDTTVDALSTSLASRAGAHAEYFVTDQRTADDAYVADTFADWIKGYTSPHD